MNPAHGQETAVADLIVPLHTRRRSRANHTRLLGWRGTEGKASPSAVTIRP
jgi:hypothetical protein